MQLSPSSQGLLLATFCVVQPLAGLQPSVVHALPSSQVIASPTQLPLEQWSAVVHALPSLQVCELGAFGKLQPVTGSHWSSVHSLPSLQEPVWFVCWQTPFAQVSSVQNFPSSQLVQAPPFRPHCVGELTMHCWPEMQPVQQRVPTQTPPEH